ncbi:hypothetical protein J5839_03790, partial [Methanosarcinaceae archaeon]|nr:hypothetical protein [Methanosarcinaceae archaeon]
AAATAETARGIEFFLRDLHDFTLLRADVGLHAALLREKPLPRFGILVGLRPAVMLCGHSSGGGRSGGYSSGSGSGRSGGYSSGSGRNGGYSSGGRHGSNAPKKPAYRKNARPPVNRGRK